MFSRGKLLVDMALKNNTKENLQQLELENEFKDAEKSELDLNDSQLEKRTGYFTTEIIDQNTELNKIMCCSSTSTDISTCQDEIPDCNNSFIISPPIQDAEKRLVSHTNIETEAEETYLETLYESSDEFIPSTDEEDLYSSSTEKSSDEENSYPNEINNTHDSNEEFNQSETEEVNQAKILPKRKLKQFPQNPKVSRKRIRKPETWKRVEAATNRQRGRKYLSQKGYEVPEKNICLGNICHENCKLQCTNKFPIELRNSIFDQFYKLDINAKNSLLFKSIVGRPTKRVLKNAKKHKSFSYDYFVTSNNKQIKVCKRAFCTLFQISKKKVEIIQRKLKKGSSAPSPDKRGKHFNRPHKLTDDVMQYIMEHIQKFPAESSHYSRNSNPYKMYLSPRLNMSLMYKLYLEECENDKKSNHFIVKKSTYANIFCTKFNLSFSHPKSDTCNKCDAGESNEEHKDNVTNGFNLLKADREIARNDKNVLYITVDLQQTMPLPKLTTNKAFYLRQLWFYNLGIHSVSTNGDKPYMQTWTEDIAGRGSSEVASCLYNFIQNCEEAKTRNHLVIWSDSCSGQNKNFQMICFYQFLIMKGIFKTIDHKFPEVGHTYLDSDRDFGRIEKILRKHDTIYTPQQYRNLIQKGSIKSAIITDMEHHFQNFELLAKNLGIVQRKKNTLNEIVHFRDGIKWIRVEKFGSYLYKESYDPYTPFKEVLLLKNDKNRGTDIAVKNVELSIIRNKTGNISEKKLENIKDQLKYVPLQDRWFYEQFFPENPAEPSNKKNKNSQRRKTT